VELCGVIWHEPYPTYLLPLAPSALRLCLGRLPAAQLAPQSFAASVRDQMVTFACTSTSTRQTYICTKIARRLSAARPELSAHTEFCAQMMGPLSTHPQL